MRITSTRGAMITMMLVTIFAIGAASATAALAPRVSAFVSPNRSAEPPVTLTVREAWQESGRDYGRFVGVVRSMALMSVEKRGYRIQGTREAGLEIGRRVRADAQRDPDQLLYAVVDNAVRQYAADHPGGR